MNLVDEVYFAVALTEFVFGINEDKALLGCHLAATLEEGVGVFLQLLIVLGAYNALGDDFLFGDVFVVSLVGLSGGGDDGGGELLVLAHALGEGYATD